MVCRVDWIRLKILYCDSRMDAFLCIKGTMLDCLVGRASAWFSVDCVPILMYDCLSQWRMTCWLMGHVRLASDHPTCFYNHYNTWWIDCYRFNVLAYICAALSNACIGGYAPYCCAHSIIFMPETIQRRNENISKCSLCFLCSWQSSQLLPQLCMFQALTCEESCVSP